MNEAKIQLSKEEMDLMINADWILTKNGILQKVKTLFAILSEKQQNIISYMGEHLPVEVTTISPKISKGENYQGLPYLVLDYPRYFEKENVFAIRTMFWWGHFFSSTLHLAGRYKQIPESRLSNAYPVVRDSYICVGADEWQHHFEKENYLPIAEMKEEPYREHLHEKSFIKLAYRVSLQQWDEVIPLLEDHFKKWLKLLAD